METINNLVLEKQECLEDYPSLFKHVASKSIEGFDNVELTDSMNRQCHPPSDSSLGITVAEVIESTSFREQIDTPQTSPFPRPNEVSISMPCSPLGVKRVLFSDEVGSSAKSGTTGTFATSLDYILEKPKQAKFYSQPMPYKGADAKGNASDPTPHVQKNPRVNRLKDKRYNSFKTWSGKLERQLSHIGGKQPETEPQVNDSQLNVAEIVPVERYFAALEGPELETLRGVRLCVCTS